MKIGIIGRSGRLIRTAELLAEAGYEIPVVWTCRAEASYDCDETDFRNLADSLGAAYFCTNAINTPESVDELKSFNCDIAVSVHWLTILRKPAMEAFKHGILNAHGGDLPGYRGNACPNWAILNGDESTGLTVHLMAEGLDEGPIVLKDHFPLNEEVYIGDVYRWFDERVPEMMVTAVRGILTGELTPQEQDLSAGVGRAFPRRPSDSVIHWPGSTQAIMRNIRASSHPFAGAFCTLEGKQRVTVWRARPHSPGYDFYAVPGQVCFATEGNPVIATGDGMIELLDVDVEGCGDEQESKAAILKSLRNRLT